jgi:hypothetical protein
VQIGSSRSYDSMPSRFTTLAGFDPPIVSCSWRLHAAMHKAPRRTCTWRPYAAMHKAPRPHMHVEAPCTMHKAPSNFVACAEAHQHDAEQLHHQDLHYIKPDYIDPNIHVKLYDYIKL